MPSIPKGVVSKAARAAEGAVEGAVEGASNLIDDTLEGAGNIVDDVVGGAKALYDDVVGSPNPDVAPEAPVTGRRDTLDTAKLMQLPEVQAALEGNGIDAAVYPEKSGLPMDRADKAVQLGDDKRASTMVPTAKVTKKNPIIADPVKDVLTVGRESLANAEPRVANLIKAYPNYKAGPNPEDSGLVVDDFTKHIVDNLLYLHDEVDDVTRQRSSMWYDGGRALSERYAEQFSVNEETIAGMIAVQSPQRDWFMNVSLGERVVSALSESQEFVFDDAMQKVVERIYAKPVFAGMIEGITGKALKDVHPLFKSGWIRAYDEAHNARTHRIITPEGEFAGDRLTGKGKPMETAWGSLSQISKAVSIYNDPSPQNISDQLGNAHKVRNFYNNIVNPHGAHGDVTIDTHAVAAGLLRPLSGKSIEVQHNLGAGVSDSLTGARGTYGIFADAYRIAAAQRGILPRQMQSITWEAVRGLFPAAWKSNKTNVKTTEDMWKQYQTGAASYEEARGNVVEYAGGINPPEWAESNITGSGAVIDSSYESELSGLRLSRRGPKSLDNRNGTGVARDAAGLERSRRLESSSIGSEVRGDDSSLTKDGSSMTYRKIGGKK